MAQYQLYNITWKLDFSPTGWLANDAVIIYWDTSTGNFHVTKNGVQITSGGDIPQTFTYNGLTEFDYKSETSFNVQICDATDLLQFSRDSLFPYASLSRLADHPACDLTASNNVCDLNFNLLSTSTPVSNITASDGTITVSATSSAPSSIEYRLNSAFEYGDGTGQASGTFTGLTKGNYIVFARDSYNCERNISVSVGVTKDYQPRYQLTFYNLSNKYIKVEILENGYAGSVDDTIKGGTGSPLILRSRRESETDKFVPVIATEVEFILMSETNNQFVELYTNDPEKYRLRISIDGSVVWLGKVLPQQYNEDYISAPYPVTVIATDALPSLNEVMLLDDDNNQLRGVYSQITLLAWILKKLGLELSIRSGCNIYATGMDSTATDDPLDQAYVDIFSYYIESSTPSCMDVIKKILTPYGAQLIQYNNYWNIVRVEEKVLDYDYREYDEDGAYVTNGSYDPVVDVKQKSEVLSMHWANVDAKMTMEPGFGAIQVIYVLGLYNIFQNGEFRVLRSSAYSGSGTVDNVTENVVPDLSGFQIVNDGNVIIQSLLTVDDSDNVSLVLRYVDVGGYLLSKEIPFKLGIANWLRITIKYKLHWFNFNSEAYYTKIKFMIKWGDYYLLNTGEWSTDESLVAYYLKGEDFDKDQTFSITGQLPDNDLDYFFDFHNLSIRVYTTSVNDWEFENITNLKAKETVDLVAGHRTELKRTFSWSGGTYYIAYYELKFTTDSSDDVNLITPDDFNSGTNPKKWNLVRISNIVENQPYDFTIHSVYGDVLQNEERQMPVAANYSKLMEPNNPFVINKVIHHGSIVEGGKTTYKKPTTSAETNLTGRGFSNNSFFDTTAQKLVAFINSSATANNYGFLRDSAGDGFTTWTRDAVPEVKDLESIVMEMYSTQYNRPWQKITGSLVSNDRMMTPIDSIKDFTADSDRKYYPVALEIDYYKNMYRGEFLELTDFSDDTSANVSAGYTIGFSLGFTS